MARAVCTQLASPRQAALGSCCPNPGVDGAWRSPVPPGPASPALVFCTCLLINYQGVTSSLLVVLRAGPARLLFPAGVCVIWDMPFLAAWGSKVLECFCFLFGFLNHTYCCRVFYLPEQVIGAEIAFLSLDM